MAGATVTPLARFPLFTSIGVPAITAGGLVLGVQPGYMTYMPYPDGEGDVTWKGDLFGLTAPAGSNVWYIAVTITYRVSTLAAFSLITAQLYIAGSPVGSPASFTPSITPATGTVFYTGGVTPADLPTLAVQVTFHQTRIGLAYVTQAYAAADYSSADSVGIFTVTGKTSSAVPALQVSSPATATLVAQGAVVQTLIPSFGQPTTAGDLLIGWTLNNSSSPTFDTTCNDPAWALIGYAGGSYGWRSLWYRAGCAAGEIAPVFSGGGAFSMSQLLEFSGVTALDQSGAFYTASPDFTMSESATDTTSGDLVVAVTIWGGGSAVTPITSSVTGTDSSGAALALTTYTNDSTTGQAPYAFTWGQAGIPVGPGLTGISATLSAYGNSAAILATFHPATAPASIPGPAVTLRGPARRVIAVPFYAGRR